MTRIHTTLALLTALAAAALAPGSAGAATTCEHTTPGVLEVHASAHADQVFMQRGAADSIGVFGSAGSVTCTGAAPSMTSVDTVLVVDDSDDPGTAAGNDGGILVAISEPASFKPGKTSEPPGASEIEFLVDTKAGRDRLAFGGSASQLLIAGNDGVAWNADGDAEVIGMPFDDVLLFGGPQDDSIYAQGGDGTGSPLSTPLGVEINGGTGKDLLYGSDIASGDLIVAGDGDDTAVGFGGRDVVSPGPGDDTLQGGPGADRLDFGSAASGVTADLAQSAAQDTGDGRDSLVEFEEVSGSAFSDRLVGDAAANVLRGANGDDVLEGRGGADELQGEQGSDTASYAGSPAGVNVDLARTTQATDADKFFSIENLVGSPFADTLAGNAAANRIEARDGVGDRVSCGGGADTAITDRRSLDVVAADCDTVDALAEPPAPPPPGPATTPPTAPSVPPAADRTLSFTLGGAKRQRVLRQRGVNVRVRCPLENCTAVATASASFRVARSTRKKTTVRLRPVSARVAAGSARTVTLRLSRRQLAALRRAFAAGERPRLRVTATARDAAGNRVRRVLPVSGKR